jgi:hypothetical protein
MDCGTFAKPYVKGFHIMHGIPQRWVLRPLFNNKNNSILHRRCHSTNVAIRVLQQLMSVFFILSMYKLSLKWKGRNGIACHLQKLQMIV